MLSFHVKFVQTDGETDRRTMVKQYAPDHSMRGHKKNVFVKHECPRNGHFLRNVTFIFDLDLCR